MALDYTMTEGDLEVQIKWIARQNLAQMITDGTLSAADYPVLKGGLKEFGALMDEAFTQFVADTALASFTSHKVESWREMRDVVSANFVALDAIVNP